MEIDKARSNFYKESAENIIKNHKCWKDIKEIDPIMKPTISSINHEDTGIKIPDKGLPEQVNNFFVGIGAKLARKFRKVKVAYSDEALKFKN